MVKFKKQEELLNANFKSLLFKNKTIMKKVMLSIAVVASMICSCKKENVAPVEGPDRSIRWLDTNYNSVNVSYSCPTGSTMTYSVDGTVTNAPNNRILVLRGGTFKLMLVKPSTDNTKYLSFTLEAKSNKTLQVIHFKQESCSVCDTLTYQVTLN